MRVRQSFIIIDIGHNNLHYAEICLCWDGLNYAINKRLFCLKCTRIIHQILVHNRKAKAINKLGFSRVLNVRYVRYIEATILRPNSAKQMSYSRE